jgi:hypothetical protein
MQEDRLQQRRGDDLEVFEPRLGVAALRVSDGPQEERSITVKHLRRVILGLALAAALIAQATPASADDLPRGLFRAFTTSSESSSPGWE